MINNRHVGDLEANLILMERRRIAAEIHDGTLQHLTAALNRLRIAARLIKREHPAFHALADGAHLVQASIDETRSAIFPLVSRPSAPRLATRVLRVVRRLRSRTSMSVHLAPLPILSDRPAIEEAMGGIIEEALMNASKHAKARNVWVEVSVGDAVVTGIVRDDGVGFSPLETAGPAAVRKSLGLRLIRERARLTGGDVQISSQPNGGTIVQARLPLGTPVARARVIARRAHANATRLGSPIAT